MLRVIRHAGSAGQEVGWLLSRAVLYPAGLVGRHRPFHDARYRLDTLSPMARALIVNGIESYGTPIVLVHGIVDNRSAFSVLQRALRRRGFGHLTTINYSPLLTDVRKAALGLGRHIERVCAETGYERVHVVGHSLGGVIGRYYAQRLGGDSRVDTLVTVGSPHAGTRLASLFPVLVARQLRPGSGLMRELAAPTYCRTRFVAVHSDRDEIIIPNSSARLEHPDLIVKRVLVRGVGHIALLADSGSVRAVVDALSVREDVPDSWPAERHRFAAS